jgi:hypothetical protein
LANPQMGGKFWFSNNISLSLSTFFR